MCINKLSMNDLYEVTSHFNSQVSVDHRYASFDFCYSNFHPLTRKTDDIQINCLHLGFYLASWGMMRGSSFLLQKSVRHFASYIEYVNILPQEYWDDDVDTYCKITAERIFELYAKTLELIIPDNHQPLTLTTKILLGVFGNVPAFDTYFRKTMKHVFMGRSAFSTFSVKNLMLLNEFYLSNRDEIDRVSRSQKLLSFDGSVCEVHNYPKIKIIDTYAFNKGLMKRGNG